MKIHKYLFAAGLCLGLGNVALQADEEPWVRINEIRIIQPGSDTDEYFELQGTPGYSLDDIWYLVLGDHSNFGNQDPNPPNYRSGVVEFAIDLSGEVIPESGLFVVVPTSFTLRPLSEIIAGGGMVISNFEFENNDNVTHILVRGYQGPEVLVMADQYGELAVDLDPNNDGTLIDPLPWDETIDAIGFRHIMNEDVVIDAGEEFVYGELLGFLDLGPDSGGFVPAHVYRGANDGQWNIGIYSLADGTDTPGLHNLDSPLEPLIGAFSPRTVKPAGSITITGSNFTTVTSVLVGGSAAQFEVVSDNELVVTLSQGSTGGTLSITNDHDTTTTESAVRVLALGRTTVFYEDFEAGLGDFLVVSLASNQDWVYRRFGENGFAQMSGFGADIASDDWLITPAIDLSTTENPALEFVTAINFSGPDLEVKISTDFTGNPLAATWSDLGGTLSPSGYAITPSGPISLDNFVGETVNIAFRYTSLGPDSGQGTTSQVHEVMVVAEDKEDPFETGWTEHPQLGRIYVLSPIWAWHEILNFVSINLYPWINLPEYGWLFHAGGDVESGTWFNSPVLGNLWTRASLNGVFFYEDGSMDSFFLGPQ